MKINIFVAPFMAFVTTLVLVAGPFVPVATLNAAPSERVDVLIGFNNTPGLSEQALVRAFGGEITQSYSIVPAVAASVPVTALNGLKNHPLITAVEADAQVYAHDAELDNSWGVKKIGAGTVHTAGNTGYGVRVAILDSGIDYTHPDLAANYAGGYDFINNDSDPMDDYGHGTHVAGTVAGVLNGSGVVGVAPNARIFALKVLGSNGTGSFSAVIAALEWAMYNGIKITNNSYGSNTNPGVIVEQAFINSNNFGILHIASAGNSGQCTVNKRMDSVGYPAHYASVMAVAATDANDARPCFSSVGSTVEISAPGVAINSTTRGGSYEAWSGTSMASPHVVGVAALVVAAGEYDASVIRQILTSTAKDLGTSGKDNSYGYGRVQAVEAVAAVGTVLPPPPTTEDPTCTPGQKKQGKC